MLQFVARTILVIALLWVVGAFLGMIHPLGDSLAVFVIYAAAVGLAATLITWRWWPARGAAVLFALVLIARAAVGVDWSPVQTPSFIVYQKNLYYLEADRSAFIEDVMASDADFVTLQEVSPVNLPVMTGLLGHYPHQKFCGIGIAVLSRWPLEERQCRLDVGFLDVSAETPQGPVRVIALHLHWPFPLEQASDIDQILARLAPPDGRPTIVGGDFNMQPWGYSVRRLAAATGVSWIGHAERTYEVFGLPLMIDHVLAGPNARGDITVRPRLGSDHFGILARIAFTDP